MSKRYQKYKHWLGLQKQIATDKSDLSSEREVIYDLKKKVARGQEELDRYDRKLAMMDKEILFLDRCQEEVHKELSKLIESVKEEEK